MLRIIAGEHRGRILKTVIGNNTRPTSDKVKESLFNILQNKLPESYVLDLFSGTGNLGLEALSRGSKGVVFVEKDSKALAVLRDNCKALDYMDYIDILPIDVLKAIPELSLKNKVFDIVFMDPPYNKDLEIPAVSALQSYNLLNENGIIIIEHLDKDLQPDRIGDFIQYDFRLYGHTGLSFYRKDALNEDSSLPGKL